MKRLPGSLVGVSFVLTLHAQEVEELLGLVAHYLETQEDHVEDDNHIAEFDVATLQHVEAYMRRKIQDKAEGR